MKNETVKLGTLGLMEYFKLPNSDITYRTINYPPLMSSPTYGHRWALNMLTFKAKWFHCRENVFHVKQKD